MDLLCVFLGKMLIQTLGLWEVLDTHLKTGCFCCSPWSPGILECVALLAIRPKGLEGPSLQRQPPNLGS